ncbi:MAG: DUF2721 domain-containing protein [Candidatus Binatia bacterium]
MTKRRWFLRRWFLLFGLAVLVSTGWFVAESARLTTSTDGVLAQPQQAGFESKKIVPFVPTSIPISSEILGAMITPAVLISACGVLVLSTSNRVGRTVDRVRSLAAEVERLQMHPESFSTPSQKMSSRRKHVADQLAQLSARAVLLRSAMTALYSAIGLLVGTSILVGVVALLQWQYSSLPVVLGFAGAAPCSMAVCYWFREARLAVQSTLQEVSFAREAVLRSGPEKEG